jgi:hypothetical protein
MQFFSPLAKTVIPTRLQALRSQTASEVRHYVCCVEPISVYVFALEINVVL